MENDEEDNEEINCVGRQYCNPNNRGLCDNNPPSKPKGNKHSYFLRAKAPRFVGFQVSDLEDGEFKKSSSSFCKPFLSSPLNSRGSKSEHCDYIIPNEEEDLANCLVMLSNKSCGFSSDEKDEINKDDVVVEKGMFQCKACKKVFNSHQALGGHRASHKKVKGCFASKLDGLNDEENGDEDSIIQEDKEPLIPLELDAIPTRKRAKMHECSVCRRVFSSGQALGGHKRCHWLTTSTDNAFIPTFHDLQYDHQSQQLCKKPMLITSNHDHQDHQLDLNLNLPPAAAPQHHDQNHDDKTTRLCLQQQWPNHNQQKTDSHMNNGDEGYGMKLRKLSDLRDVTLDGGWLQMGIASTTEMRS